LHSNRYLLGSDAHIAALKEFVQGRDVRATGRSVVYRVRHVLLEFRLPALAIALKSESLVRRHPVSGRVVGFAIPLLYWLADVALVFLVVLDCVLRDYRNDFVARCALQLAGVRGIKN
jgi:hypothetical protein